MTVDQDKFLECFIIVCAVFFFLSTVSLNRTLTSGTDCTGPRPEGPATGSADDGRPANAECFGLLADAAAAAAAAAAALPAAGEPRDMGRPSAGLWRPEFECAGPGEPRLVGCDAGDVVDRSLAAAR